MEPEHSVTCPANTLAILSMSLKQSPDNPRLPSGPNPDSGPVIVLSRSPLLDMVLQYLSPGDVARLQCTSKVISDALIAWKRSVYNINRFLERFFKDPVAFRVLQAQTDLLISGSSALQFMDRYVLNPSSKFHHSSPTTCYPNLQYFLQGQRLGPLRIFLTYTGSGDVSEDAKL